MPLGDPLVSIRCTVYNHEPFLRQCLDGFVMQQTTFPYEAIVHDDASTDRSAAIIREYAERYPDIIKPIYETENQYRKGTIGGIMDAVMHPASKYIALCEGDDYWTDPLKLQKQIDFLESHPDYVLCCGNHYLYHQDTDEMEKMPVYDWVFVNEYKDDLFFNITLNNYFDHWWIRTLTAVYRRHDYRSEVVKKGYSSIRDDVFYYTVLSHGKGALLRDVLGVYRLNENGVWAGNDKTDNYRIAINHAFQIRDIEGDHKAYLKTRSFTLKLLNELNARGEKNYLWRELKNYYDQVPFSEFLKLITAIARDHLSGMYHQLTR